LASEFFDEKTQWKKVKKIVRAYEGEEGCLIFDGTIIEKPYMDENDIICRHFDHKENKAVKGISLLSAFYYGEKGGQTVRLPTGYRIPDNSQDRGI
jgi:hypothetical protein